MHSSDVIGVRRQRAARITATYPQRREGRPRGGGGAAAIRAHFRKEAVATWPRRVEHRARVAVSMPTARRRDAGSDHEHPPGTHSGGGIGHRQRELKRVGVASNAPGVCRLYAPKARAPWTHARSGASASCRSGPEQTIMAQRLAQPPRALLTRLSHRQPIRGASHVAIDQTRRISAAAGRGCGISSSPLKPRSFTG